MADAKTTTGATGVALVSTDLEFRRTLKERLEAGPNGLAVGLEISADVADIDEQDLEGLRELGPGVVFLDLESDPDLGLRFAQYLLDSSLTRAIIGAAPSPSSEFLMAAMQAGVTAFLPKPATAESVEAALQTVRRKTGIRDGQGGGKRGEILAVFGAKAGAGCTTVSTNLSVEIGRLSRQRTLLVDLDLERGDTALQLGLEPRFSILDLLENLHRLDAGLLTSYLARHASGLELVPAPPEPVEYGQIPAEQIERLLTLLAEQYDYVVVDCPGSMNPVTRTALRTAGQIYVVTTGELPGLRSLKRCLPMLREIAGDGEASRLRLLVNRYEPNQPLSLKEIEWAVELKVFHTLRNDYETVMDSINSGDPVVQNRNSRYATDITSVASAITGVSVSEPAGPRWLRVLRAPFRRRRSRTDSSNQVNLRHD